jgi:hypothetical protein
VQVWSKLSVIVIDMCSCVILYSSSWNNCSVTFLCWLTDWQYWWCILPLCTFMYVLMHAMCVLQSGAGCVFWLRPAQGAMGESRGRCGHHEDWLTDHLANQLANQLTNQLATQLTDDGPGDWPANLQIELGCHLPFHRAVQCAICRQAKQSSQPMHLKTYVLLAIRRDIV